MRAFVVFERDVIRECEDAGPVLVDGHTTVGPGGKLVTWDLPGEVINVDGENVRVYATWALPADGVPDETHDPLRKILRPLLAQ